MPAHAIVVEKRHDFRWDDPGQRVITVLDYLDHAEELKLRNVKVVNLCRDFAYLSVGYYCSLLAEARRDRVIPSVSTILELDQRALYKGALPDLDGELKRCLKSCAAGKAPAELFVFFGKTDDADFENLAEAVFDRFRTPLLKLDIECEDGTWHIAALHALAPKEVPAELDALFLSALESYTQKRWVKPRMKSVPRYDIAILHDPDDKLPPSDARALHRFVRVGSELGMDVELITRKDFAKLPQFDALFIRDTTSVPHYTFRFAKRAEEEGMPVIDDPASILRCGNKVYLAELLAGNGVPAPRTMIFAKNRIGEIEKEFRWPVVLKIPDGSFSRGVKKAANRDELDAILKEMFKESQMVLAQEYMPTDFDWRVGILDRKPLFVCQYFMSKGHWQIVKHEQGGTYTEGAGRTWAVDEAPREVVETALKAANLIGDGLYGVDLKQNEHGVFVIEINDNPNIDLGVEDNVLKDELYRIVLRSFQRRIDQRRQAR
ncbi:RimK family protein [Zavarzinia sp.]|uniref:RimK family protein n=1 Tax=Zavarzinia sp. TaxID=2027920 RepID=UPI0035615731